MGNHLCKTELQGARSALSEVFELLACDVTDDGEREEMMMDRRQQRYMPGMQVGAPTYAGLAPGNTGSAFPRKQASPSNAQRGVMPGESVLVTYDVTGESVRLTPPGESMVVSSANMAARLEAPSPARTVSPQKLQPTQSFDVNAPYKVGDQIEIWSSSQQAWCLGTVEKADGDWIHISYKGPGGGQLMSKIMPNGHEHLRFPWHSNAAPEYSSPFRGGESPQRELPASPVGSPNRTALNITVPPSSPGPTVAAGYGVGESIELWSTSQNNWCSGVVHKNEGEWVTINYQGPGGVPMTKIMPNGHESLRRAGAINGGLLGAQRDVLSPIPESVLSPMQSQDVFLPAPPPAPNRAYGAGDSIEIWSTSQNAWCQGSVSKVDGDWAHIAYRGPGGQPMNKIMPNGHAHLRLLNS